MTREEAIKVLRTERVEIGGDAVSVARWLTALDVAIKALKDVTDKNVGKNEPLTLDELREVAETGDPVWLVGAYRADSWVVIENVGKNCYGMTTDTVDYAEFGSDEPYDFAISDYGDAFIAYRQKPEEDDHDERKENENVRR